MIALEPPLTRSGAIGWSHIDWGQPLAVGPRYVRTSGMSRWHRPRSGTRRQNGHTSYHLWCGQLVSTGSLKAPGVLTADTIDDELPVCGTCEGRACGAGQDDWPGDGELLFSPRRLTPPKHCPGSRREGFFAQIGTTAGRCLVCGAIESLRGMGGPYNPKWAMVQHPPAEGLVPGCPFHAWTSITVRDGAVVCHCAAEGRAS